MEKKPNNNYRFLDDNSQVSVVIPTYNRYDMLKRLIRSLEETEYPVREIIVVDDCSSDTSYEKLCLEFPYIKYIRHDHVMYVGESRNDGIRIALGDFIFMVDDDNTVDPKCISHLVNQISRDTSIGVAAPVTCYYSNKNMVMYAGSLFSRYSRRTIFLYMDRPYSELRSKVYETDGFANSYMFRSYAVRKVYPIPKEILLGGEDGYIQFRIKKELGLKLVLVGNARVYHDIAPHQVFTRMTPFKLYYAIRGKITFEKRLEEPRKKILFYIAIPVYFAFYVNWALRSNSKFNGLIAVMRGLKDGLLGIYANRY
jgi:GT2 family glycosyltransferase